MKKSLKPESNTKYTQIAFYVIVTSLILMILVQIFLHLGFLTSLLTKGIRWIGGILRPLMGGFILAYLLYPMTTWFQKKLLTRQYFQKHRKASRGLAVLFTMLIAFLALFLLLSVLFSTISSGIRTIHFDDIGDFIQSLAVTIQSFFNSFARRLRTLNLNSEDFNSILDQVSKWGINYAQGIGNSLFDILRRFPSIFSNFVFALVFGIYFLLDGEGLKSYWDRVFRSVTGAKIYKGFHVFLGDMNHVFSGYIRGQLLDAVFMFAMISLTLSLAGVRFAILIGLLTGLGNLIPYVGPFLAYGSSLIVNLIEMDIRKLIISIVIIFILQTIDGNVVNPKLLSSTVDVHPMLVITALLIGSAANGLIGMLLAVPVAALARIEFERLIDFLEKRRENGSGQEQTPPHTPSDPDAANSISGDDRKTSD